MNPSSDDFELSDAANSDSASIALVLSKLYQSISFSPPDEADWEGFRRLCVPYALLVHAPASAEGSPVVLDPDTFIARYKENVARSELATRGFFEREIWRRVETFGNVAHVFSAFEAGFANGEVFARGVNSIQLLQANGRWWVLTILWDDERENHPLPAV